MYLSSIFSRNVVITNINLCQMCKKVWLMIDKNVIFLWLYYLWSYD